MRRGTTLLETMVGAAILSGLTLALFFIYRMGASAWKKGEAQTEMLQDLQGSIARLTRETFGPILHVVRYKGDKLGAVCEAINATGYGLTLGIHTRIASSADEIAARVRAGNIYVNRNQIGAVVEAQPFGGEGLSGTGPKAGGPHYLHRFATERTLSVNTTAAGGNASLLSLGDGG